MKVSNIVKKAEEYARLAHASQLRMYSGLPYFTHLLEVKELVAEIGACEASQCAALLHDTIEDTATSYADIVTEFGLEIADLVQELTDVYTPDAFPQFNRNVRKRLEAERLWGISSKAQTVKFADFLSNGYDIARHNMGFGHKFFREIDYSFLKMELGDKRLGSRVAKMLDEFLLTRK